MNTAVKSQPSLLAKMAENYNLEAGKLHQVLKQTAFANCRTDEEFMAMCIVANQYGLNPLTKEIYAFPTRTGAVIPIVGIDGWSRIINHHPEFDGLEFDETSESCTCIIYRKDRNHPVKVTEWLSECKGKTRFTKDGKPIESPWDTHPRRMLRHRALIQAARLAFGFAGIYDADEAREEQSLLLNEQKGTSGCSSVSLLEKIHTAQEKLVQCESVSPTETSTEPEAAEVMNLFTTGDMDVPQER